MGFDKVPTELVCSIIYWAVQDPKISSFIRLREVNSKWGIGIIRVRSSYVHRH